MFSRLVLDVLDVSPLLLQHHSLIQIGQPILQRRLGSRSPSSLMVVLSTSKLEGRTYPFLGARVGSFGEFGVLGLVFLSRMNCYFYAHFINQT